MKPIAQLLKELSSVQFSQGTLDAITCLEECTLRYAYECNPSQMPFEDWYKANFKQETK